MPDPRLLRYWKWGRNGGTFFYLLQGKQISTFTVRHCSLPKPSFSSSLNAQRIFYPKEKVWKLYQVPNRCMNYIQKNIKVQKRKRNIFLLVDLRHLFFFSQDYPVLGHGTLPEFLRKNRKRFITISALGSKRTAPSQSRDRKGGN